MFRDSPGHEDSKYVKKFEFGQKLQLLRPKNFLHFWQKWTKFAIFHFLGGGLVKKCSKVAKTHESNLIRAREIDRRCPFFPRSRRSRDIGSESEIRRFLDPGFRTFGAG